MNQLIEKFLAAFASILAHLGFKPSAQQLGIFAWFAYGQGNLVVRARAGTGKTTTIMAALNFVREKNVLVAAFSKDIADELTSRVAKLKTKSKIDARTLHSLGSGLCWRYLGGGAKFSTEIDNTRGKRLARQAIESLVYEYDGVRGDKPVKLIARRLPERGQSPAIVPPRDVVNLVAKLAGLGKNCAPFATFPDVCALGSKFDVFADPEDESVGWTPDLIALCAHKAMELATLKEKNGKGQFVYDFDDMLFLPVRMNWASPRYDLVIIDEAQDMNETQLMLAQRVCKGRVVVVGDDRQAIYGFRGADSKSIDRLKSELKAEELPLTVTYRCGKKIVALAQNFVSDYQAAPDAHDGEVRTGASWETIYRDAQGGDFVLSRNNAQITKICLHLLRLNKPAFIRGRDVGDQLQAVIKKIGATTIIGLIQGLETWSQQQFEFMQAKLGKDQELDERAVEAVLDTAETIKVLAEGMPTVNDLCVRINSLFLNDDGGPAIICCSTIHRSKGLEADRVFLLVDTLREDSDEEINIAYVGITRAKKILVQVEGK